MNNTVAANIDEYIAGFPADIQMVLQQVRETVHKAAPTAKETIKYGMPTFTLGGNLVYFGAFKKHLGFYPVPNQHPDFSADFAPYKQGRGLIQFPYAKPMPLDLITRIVSYRIAQLEEKGSKIL